MKVLIAGDYCPQNRVLEAFDKREYDRIFGGVNNILQTVDYSIVNFECPVTKGDERPITKFGPNIQCNETGVEALKWAGFDCVTLANNHFRDYGNDGVKYSLSCFKKHGIDTVGGGLSIREASEVLYKQIGDKKLAIINCCEHEFTIATHEKCGSNPLNPIQQYYAIKDAKTEADYVLVIVHGGHEHYQLPSIRMQETYRFFIDAGADAVVNHHQHCYSGFEIYKKKPIFYGLGNFCFDNLECSKKIPSWKYGYLLELIFTKERIKYKWYPYEQSASKPGVTLLHENAFNDKIYTFNSIISNPENLLEAQNDYYKKQEYSILSAFQPFRSRFSFAARRFKLIPTIMSKRWKTALYNIILCESHRDKVEFFLENYNK